MRIPAEPRKQSSEWVLQFINIVFLILMFFLAAGTIAEQAGSDVKPPVSVVAGSADPPHDALYVAVDGTLRFGGQAVQLSDVARAREQDKTLTIVADRQLPARQLVGMIGDLRKAGITGIRVITERVAP